MLIVTIMTEPGINNSQNKSTDGVYIYTHLTTSSSAVPQTDLAALCAVPVCPHAGGICLNEMVQHLQLFDFVRLSGSTENRRVEYVAHLSEHLATPADCRRARYFPPQVRTVAASGGG